MPQFLSPFEMGGGPMAAPQPGALPTLGGANAYQAQPMDPQAQMIQARRQQQLADALMAQSGSYIPNSGIAGSLAMIAQAWAGKKLNRKADESVADAVKRQTQHDAEVKAATEAKAAADLQAKFERDKALKAAPSYEGTPAELRTLQALQQNPQLAQFDLQRRQAIAAAGRAPPAPDRVSLQSVQIPQSDGSFRVMNYNSRTGEYSEPNFGGTPAAPSAAGQVAGPGQVSSAAPTLGIKPPSKKAADPARTQSAYDTASEAVDTIDALTAMDGFKSLGTVSGDVMANVPMMRTDAKTAQEQLGVVGNQIALSTMASLKALSAAGATGFGALNQQELALLKNSVRSLQSGKLDHDTLAANLQVIKDKMAKIRDAAGTQLGIDSPAAAAAAPPNAPAAGNGWAIQVVQ